MLESNAIGSAKIKREAGKCMITHDRELSCSVDFGEWQMKMAAQPEIIIELIDARIQRFVSHAVLNLQETQNGAAFEWKNPDAVLESLKAKMA